MHNALTLLVSPGQSYVEVTIATVIDDSLITWIDVIYYTSREVVYNESKQKAWAARDGWCLSMEITLLTLLPYFRAEAEELHPRGTLLYFTLL